MKFRKRVREIEAICWTGNNLAEVQAFCGEDYTVNQHGIGKIFVINAFSAFDGFLAEVGDYILRDGGYIECMTPESFTLEYERVE